MIRNRTLPFALALASTLAPAACGAGSGNELETRTFRIEHLEPSVAQSLIGPYALSEGAVIQVVVGGGARALSVRERKEILDRMQATLAEYDRPLPSSVSLHFQIIEADGYETADPEIAEVEAALRELFRFRGYRSIGEAWVQGRRFGEFRQRVADVRDTNQSFALHGRLHSVKPAATGRGTVDLDVELAHETGGSFLATQISIPIGQTVVIGSGKPAGRAGTLILAVRPEIAR